MKDYFHDLNENYSIIKQIKLAVTISFGLIILDVFNVPSKIIIKYDFSVFLLILIGILILIGLTIIENGFIDIFKIKSINPIDTIIYVKLFSILIYLSLIYLMGERYLYKLIILKVLLILTFISACIRIYIYDSAKKNQKNISRT